MSISLKELLGGSNYNTLDPIIQTNLMELLAKINKVRDSWGKPMFVTSGLRTLEHHIDVYKALAIKRNKPFDLSKVPMGSAHLKGGACDLSDPDGSLYQWTQDNTQLMEDIGLWMEIKDDQARVHYQIYAPKSGDRFFKP